MNNRGYTIKVEIHDGPHNRIQSWNYAFLVQAFNGSNESRALGLEAHTPGQLSGVLKGPWSVPMDRPSLNAVSIKMIVLGILLLGSILL